MMNRVFLVNDAVKAGKVYDYLRAQRIKFKVFYEQGTAKFVYAGNGDDCHNLWQFARAC